MGAQPNHLHGIIWILDDCKGEASDNETSFSRTADASPLRRPIGTQRGSLGALLQNFKSISTRKIHQWSRNPGMGKAFAVKDVMDSKLVSANASPLRVWQRNYFERIIRDEKELDRIRQYIIDNPRKWEEDEEYLA